MKNKLSCSQFETRIHALLDSRGDLTNDLFLKEHSAECDDCSQILASYQSLDDSFSGKLPAALQHSIAKESLGTAVLSTKPKSGYLTIVGTLALGLLIGTTFGMFTAYDGKDTSQQSTINSVAANDIIATNEISVHPTRPNAPHPQNELNLNLLSVEQLLKQFPKLELYYRYSAELPGVRPLQSSFYLAYHWFQNRFLSEQLEKSAGQTVVSD